jgi:putative intracellular protease/amidase
MNFGILVFPNVEELDFVGPWEILGMWGKFANGPENRFVVAQSIEPIICAKGLSINPHISFKQCPALDFLLVPGGEGTRQEVKNRVLLDLSLSRLSIAEPCSPYAQVRSYCIEPDCYLERKPRPIGALLTV